MNYKIGSKGADVTGFQTKLKSFYKEGTYKADGIYGKNTDYAVKQFQKSKGLGVDGIIGKNTIAAMNNIGDNSNQKTPPVRDGVLGSSGESENIKKSDIKDINDVNKYINTFNNPNAANSPTTRSDKRRTIAKTLETDLTSGIERPKRISLMNEWKKARKEAGLSDMEEIINQYDLQEREVEANLRINKFDAEGKPIAMGVIAGRQGEMTRQAREELDFIGREKNYLVNEYNSKISAVNKMMELTEKDYKYAVEDYEREFSTRKQLYTMAEDEIKTDDKGQKDQYDIYMEARKDARANGEIIVNTAIKSGKKFSDMDSETQLNLAKWGTQAGLGTNFFKDMFDISKDKPILTTIISKNKSVATILYKDGTTKKIKTGMWESTGGSGSGKAKKDYTKLNDILDNKDLSDRQILAEALSQGFTVSEVNGFRKMDYTEDEDKTNKELNNSSIAQQLLKQNITDPWGIQSDADKVDQGYEAALEELEKSKSRNGKLDLGDKTQSIKESQYKEIEKELKYYGKKSRDKEWNWLNYDANKNLD